MLWVLFFVLGAVLGSFGNVLVWRLPENKTILGRSVCDACGKTLKAYDLIPFLSMIVYRGRARCCNAWIGFSHTFFEFLTAILFLAALWVAPTPLEAVPLAVCFWLLLCIARIDTFSQMIPDALTVALIIAASVLAFIRGESPLLSIGLLLLVFGAQWLISRGRWIGSGDVFLSVGIGILVSHMVFAVLVVFVSYIIGAAFAVSLLVRKKTSLKKTIAFGPFLCSAAVIVSLWSDELLRWTGY